MGDEAFFSDDRPEQPVSYGLCHAHFQEGSAAAAPSEEDESLVPTIAANYPNIKVNKKSCTVKVHGFKRNFAGQGKSLLQLAKLANAFYEAGSRYWAELSTLSKILFQSLACCEL